jgi:hypothetical protein
MVQATERVGASLPIDPRYVSYTIDTAISVDVAYIAMEEDIRAELNKPDGSSHKALLGLLQKLLDRRAAIDEFKRVMSEPSVKSR